MSIRNRLSRIESRSGDRHRPTVRADPFWRAVRDADAAIESGDLAALVDAANQADSRDIEQRRDKTEMRRRMYRSVTKLVEGGVFEPSVRLSIKLKDCS